MMRLTDDKINAMAAELLGYCDGLNLNDLTAKGYCKACGKGVLDDTHDVPDFIHDANAVRELVLKVRRPSGPRMVGEALMPFITNRPLSIGRPNLLEFGLIASLKSITLACLVAAGKITLEQAREAMEGDNE